MKSLGTFPRLHLRRPPASAFAALSHVARCPSCGEVWRVPSTRLGDAAALAPPCSCCSERGEAPRAPQVMGPMWVGPMHDTDFVAGMRGDAAGRGWSEPDRLGAARARQAGSAPAAARRAAACRCSLLRGAGFGAAQAHSETKSLKTSATLDEVVRVVSEAKHLVGE